LGWWRRGSVLVEVRIVGERRVLAFDLLRVALIFAAEGVGKLVVLGEIVFPVFFEVVVKLVVEVVVLEVVEPPAVSGAGEIQNSPAPAGASFNPDDGAVVPSMVSTAPVSKSLDGKSVRARAMNIKPFG